VAGDHGSTPADALAPVHHLGRLSAQAIARWYTRAAIYALPARYEPFGLSVLEAARAGCALVLGDIASLRENWEGAAVFVGPDDRSALARAISELIAEPVRRAELGRVASVRARQFNIADMAGAYAGAYEAARNRVSEVM
jgi:glycosyltransferase involved in cell wall biosynthesis